MFSTITSNYTALRSSPVIWLQLLCLFLLLLLSFCWHKCLWSHVGRSWGWNEPFSLLSSCGLVPSVDHPTAVGMLVPVGGGGQHTGLGHCFFCWLASLSSVWHLFSLNFELWFLSSCYYFALCPLEQKDLEDQPVACDCLHVAFGGHVLTCIWRSSAADLGTNRNQKKFLSFLFFLSLLDEGTTPRWSCFESF